MDPPLESTPGQQLQLQPEGPRPDSQVARLLPLVPNVSQLPQVLHVTPQVQQVPQVSHVPQPTQPSPQTSQPGAPGSDGAKKGSSGRPQNPVWAHFSKVEGSFSLKGHKWDGQCNFCNFVVHQASAADLKRHVIGCQHAPEHIKKEFQEQTMVQSVIEASMSGIPGQTPKKRKKGAMHPYPGHPGMMYLPHGDQFQQAGMHQGGYHGYQQVYPGGHYPHGGVSPHFSPAMASGSRFVPGMPGMHQSQYGHGMQGAAGPPDHGFVVDTEDWNVLRKQQELMDTNRDVLVKRCRDIQRLAKHAINSLLRGDHSRSSNQLLEAESIARELLPIISSAPGLRYGTYSAAMEEYAEAKALKTYLAEGRLIKYVELKLLCEPEEYLGGILDFAGDLNRFALQRATAKDQPSVKRCKDCVDAISIQFLDFDLRNESLRRKFEVLKFTLKKLEERLYELTLLEARAPHIPAISVGGEDRDEQHHHQQQQQQQQQQQLQQQQHHHHQEPNQREAVQQYAPPQPM